MPQHKPDSNEYPKQIWHRTGRSVTVKDADAEAALGEGWSDSPGGPAGLPAGSDPLRWFDEWDLQGLTDEARLRIKAGLVKAHADVVASSREDGSTVREACLQKSFDVFANEYFLGGLLTDAVMAESLPRNVYDAAVSGGWQTGTLVTNSGCTLQFGHHWVPANTPERLKRLFEAQVWRWRGMLLEAEAKCPKTVVSRETVDPLGGPGPGSDESLQRWADLEIRFLSDERVQIFIRGRAGDTRNFAEMGFQDHRGKGRKPNAAWHVLRRLAENKGIIPAAAISGRQAIQKRAQEIRKVLCAQFDLTEDPIPFVDRTGYVAALKIRRSPACDT